MKQYDNLFSYSNFSHIYRDKVIFYYTNIGILASVWMHLDPMTPIQYNKVYPVGEWDDIKTWCKSKAYAVYCDDETHYDAFVMGLALTFWAETEDMDFWKLYAASRENFDWCLARDLREKQGS